MTANDAIRNGLDSSDFIISAYLADLTDGDLLVRPIPGMNHIAWQLGHLLAAERSWIELIKPGSCPPFPEGFAASHGKETHAIDDPARFLSLAKYQELWKIQREATRKVLDGLSAADLDRTGSEFPQFAPSVGALMNMCAVHPLMHCGQFVAVRRALNKPVTI